MPELTPAQEFRKFADWYITQYGTFKWFQSGIVYRNFKQTAHYAFWVAQGRPSERIIPTEEIKPWGVPIPEDILTGGKSPADMGYPAGEGYQWVRKYDPTTRTSRWGETPITEPEPPMPPDYQKMAYDLQLMQAQQDIESKRWAGLQSQEGAMWAQLARSQQLAEKPPWTGYPEMATQYETWRERLLSELQSPRDWISRWQVANAVNPYQSREPTFAEQRDWLQLQIPKYQQSIATMEEGGEVTKPHEVVLYNYLKANLTGYQQQLADLMSSPEAKEEEKWAQPRQTGPTTWEVGRPGVAEVPRPTTPPAPGWLPELVPGEVAGQPISKRFVPTPSGQQLTRMPWSVSEGLAGYAEFAGGRPFRDILAEAELMLPRGRGVRTTWSPARQRTFV